MKGQGGIRQHGLSLVFAVLFLAALVGQSFAGLASYNEDQLAHGQAVVTYAHFVTSSAFVVDVAENWQSEYLQFTLFILFTVWFVQKGSPESKVPGDEGAESDAAQLVGRHAKDDSPWWARAGGRRTTLYANSLVLVMGLIWIWSWFAQSVSGWSEYNADRFQDQQDALSFGSYIGYAGFWESTLQNWQSEFLAVASMAILAVYLRQRGSPESKPVGAPHDATGMEG